MHKQLLQFLRPEAFQQADKDVWELEPDTWKDELREHYKDRKSPEEIEAMIAELDRVDKLPSDMSMIDEEPNG